MSSVHDLSLVGGRLCLDFLNTANWRGNSVVEEHLRTSGDLRGWAGRMGLAPPPSDESPHGEEEGLRDLLTLRTDLRAVFLKAIEGCPIAAGDAAFLNASFAACLRTDPVAADDGLLVHAPTAAPDRRVRLPVLISAIELLTSPDRARLKRCPGDACGWLFVDQSRNRSRKWCSMELCGNREKARLHYARTRS